jgi:hypothetical protein
MAADIPQMSADGFKEGTQIAADIPKMSADG